MSERDFTLLKLAKRITLNDLPRSPRGTFLTAEACNWQVHAWESLAKYAPTLYLSNSDESDKHPHNVGDVLYDGYLARIITVEARAEALPLGFKAYYVGKRYADGRKAPAGSFDHAFVVDPAGIPVELSAFYAPIPQDRGKYETNHSFARRVKAAQVTAVEQDRTYNDHRVIFRHERMFTTAGAFDSWLAEWHSFTTQVKATSE